MCSVVVSALPIYRLAPLTTKILSTNTTVTTSATALPTSPMVGRENIAIFNNDTLSTIVYIGNASVTTASGFPLKSGAAAISIDIDDSGIIDGITGSVTADVRCLETK